MSKTEKKIILGHIGLNGGSLNIQKQQQPAHHPLLEMRPFPGPGWVQKIHAPGTTKLYIPYDKTTFLNAFQYESKDRCYYSWP